MDRLIRLGGATPASPNQFLRFLVFSRRFFLHHISEQQCFWGCRLRCIDVPLEHIIAAKAVCFGEALKPEFKAYAEQIVKNAKVLAEELVKEGFRLVSGGTDNHLCLVDVRNFHITGKEFERRLDEVQITVNKNAIPNDPEKPFVTSGVRVGTPAVTSRGFKEPEMVQIAHWMGQTARDFDTCREQVRSEVDALCRKFPIYQ